MSASLLHNWPNCFGIEIMFCFGQYSFITINYCMPSASALAKTSTQPITIPATTCGLLRPSQRFELLSFTIHQDSTEALFFARQDSLITSRFPGFEKELLRHLPNLLDNVKCFNGHDHHFATEMLATELGHLFEHIWLEVLCTEKLKVSRKAHYAGETSWNWRVDPRGLFRIHLNAGIQDKELIEKSALLSKIILEKCLPR